MRKVILLLIFSSAFVVQAQTPGWEWAIAPLHGGPTGECVAQDSNGDVYIGGMFGSDSLTFGRGLIKKTVYNVDPINKTRSMYLTKLNANGDALWAITGDQTINNQSNSNHFVNHSITSVATFNNDVYIAGWFTGDSFSFGGTKIFTQTLNSNHYFIAKLSSNGVLNFLRYSEGPFQLFGTKMNIAVSKQGEIFIKGKLVVDSIQFGSVVLKKINNANTDFIIKFSSSGSALWGKTYLDARDMAVDDAGNLLVTGSFTGSYTIGNTVLANNGGADMFIAKYDPNGSALWALRGGGLNNDYGYNITTGLGNSVYAYVRSGGNDFLLEGNYLQNNGSAILLKFDAAGSVVWHKFVGNETSLLMKSDNNGDIYYAGSTRGFTNPDAGVTFGCANGYCTYIVKYSSAGNYITSCNSASGNAASNCTPSDISVSNDKLYVTGPFSGVVDFGNIILTAIFSSNAYVAKYSGLSTGVNNIGESLFTIYPNPSTDQLFIETDNIAVEQINIYNTVGKLVNQTMRPQSKSIDISHLPAGVYVAEIKTKEAIGKRRFVKL